jgi:hypothetical protein
VSQNLNKIGHLANWGVRELAHCGAIFSFGNFVLFPTVLRYKDEERCKVKPLKLIAVTDMLLINKAFRQQCVGEVLLV